MSAARHAFLTGAAGFLGAEIARTLAARGARLHALLRPTSDRARLSALDARVHEGDLRDAAACRRALAAACAEADGAPVDVVHCGALISYRTRDAALQRAVNVDGTRHVLDACRAADVRRVLHVSSVVAVGQAAPGELLTEEHPWNCAALRVDYATTKRAAEELALAAGDALDVVVVNPGAVFGPADERSNSAFFLRRLASGRLRAAPPGTVAAVGVADVAEACALALERGAAGRRYLLAESNWSHLELFQLVAGECGVRPARRRVPPRAWAALEGGARLVDRLRPLERLTPQAMRMLGASFASDSGRARRELAWRPRPLREVVRDALAALGLGNRRAPHP